LFISLKEKNIYDCLEVREKCVAEINYSAICHIVLRSHFIGATAFSKSLPRHFLSKIFMKNWQSISVYYTPDTP